MYTVELFSGLHSFSMYMDSMGDDVFTVDCDGLFKPSLVWDLLKPFPQTLLYRIKYSDVVWMSPPCQTFSMAAGNKHWGADRKPRTQAAVDAYNLLGVCLEVAEYCNRSGKIYFIENPRARARWFLPRATRATVWYCRYGDTRAKPTDIWTNIKGWVPRTCKNGNKDCHHEAAPRGSRSGTQGVKGAAERGKIPLGLFESFYSHLLTGD